jgi:hypothetical protein
MGRYSPEDYTPDGGFSPAGLPLLLVGLIASAIGLGWLASFIGQWFYLILLFPLGIGFGLIAAGVIFGRLGKMRSPGLACLLGLLSAVVAMLAMHYFDYRRLVQDAAPGEGSTGLFSYLNAAATVGVTINGKGGRGGWNLGYTGTWIYWSLELLVVAVMSTLGMVAGATAPFCSDCNVWKEEKKLGTLGANGNEAAEHLRNGAVERLQEHEPGPLGGSFPLLVWVCPNCKSEGTIAVKLQSVTKNAKGEEDTKELVHLTYPGKALAELEALFSPRPEG